MRQTTPQVIREKLDIKSGDCIVFEIENEQVILKKSLPVDWNYLNAISETINEWLSPSPEDEEAYHDL